MKKDTKNSKPQVLGLPPSTTKKRKAAVLVKPAMVSKKDFILKAPKSATNRDIVEAARLEGISITENYVYMVRAGKQTHKKTKKVVAPRKARKSAKKARKSRLHVQGRRASKKSAGLVLSLGMSDGEFKNVVWDLGIAAMRDILDRATNPF